MDLELKNKVILVTGGASGIGEAVVRTLAIEGAIPVILDRKPREQCEALLSELDVQHVDGAYLRVDLTDESQVSEAIRAILLRFETIDGLVNNAGVNDGAGLGSTPTQFRESLERNL
ncbi:MAG: SDR family NAD(P)-dependent oxidoreductase, partial [Verrucomicrobiae bacterium]|nr:SDR family NAD(P)-dependent oxidoreductase [Verrucomicrobiae bacterium]